MDRIWRLPTVVTLLALTFVLSYRIHSRFHFPFPRFDSLIYDLSKEFSSMTSYERPLGSQASFRDFSGILLGLRRLTADIAWISLLQYYGGHEKFEDEEEGHHHDFGGGNYPALQKMVRRVVRLDPSFHFAYLVGGGALAFNLNRPKEGLEILEEGIRWNPTYWRFRLYVGAIIYKQEGKFDEMIKLLEDAILYPDCPTMIKSILANIHKRNGNYRRALEIWLDVYENERSDAWYIEQAEKQIGILKKNLGHTP